MTGGDRPPLSPETAAVLVHAIEFHVTGAAICRRQAIELFELQKGTKRPHSIEALTAGAQRATHELEAAVHCAALTSIGIALANLEAQGFNVNALTFVQADAELREQQTDRDPDREPSKPERKGN